MHEDLCAFMIISHSFFLRMRNVSDDTCRENENTHFMFHNFFCVNFAFCMIMWENMIEADKSQMTI